MHPTYADKLTANILFCEWVEETQNNTNNHRETQNIYRKQLQKTNVCKVTRNNQEETLNYKKT